MPKPRIPITCYRLQFNNQFTFRDAQAILGYLQRLGVTDVYASPLLQSRRGSGHGYDVTDPTRIDSDLGSEEQFEAFQTDLHGRGMGLLLDIVPNHMAASHENPWWMDVLENGPGSPYAAFFDIDWHAPSRTLENKILLPVLGGFYGDVLQNQELRVLFEAGRFRLQYHESFFPLGPKSYRRVLKHRQDTFEASAGSSSLAFQEYLGILSGLNSLSDRETLTVDAAGERRLQTEALKERLGQLHHQNPEFREFLTENIAQFNGKRGDIASFRLLDRVLSEQAYVLAYWQNVNEEINYRRFFTITDLVGVRVEDPAVFESVHAVIFRLVEKGAVDALRIDHIDGLRDPFGYLRRLQDRLSGGPEKEKSEPLYVVVEKILLAEETLPTEWPVHGTTGYDYLNVANRLFVDPQGTDAIEKIYFRFLQRHPEYQDVLYRKKKLVMATLLGVEMRALGRQLGILAESDRYARDLPRTDLAAALVETTACFPIYRTYTRSVTLTREAIRYIETALDAARARSPQIAAACFDFVRDVLLLRDGDHLFPDQREARLAFVMRWQQSTGPIVAKGQEDTVLYVFCPLISLNEVGGDPLPSSKAVPKFDAYIRNRRSAWPCAMNSTATHDTKRGEDVRARINVLSEIPAEWRRHLDLWSRQNARKKTRVGNQIAPDSVEEIFLYQTLLGAWPLDDKERPEFRKRMHNYTLKATREAMVHTRWTRPNLPHEHALVHFLDGLFRDKKFLADFLPWQSKLAYYGMCNGLALTLLKIFSPGIPDIYQGCDLWDLRLVDPDNRRPVDYERRVKLLDRIEVQSQQSELEFCRELTRHWQDGAIKLYLLSKVLGFRREHGGLFADGEWLPLSAAGVRKDNVLAYARRYEKSWTIAVAPRFLARAKAPQQWDLMRAFWKSTQLLLPASAPLAWRNILTGESLRCTTRQGRKYIPAGTILGNFPVAVLVPEGK
jgi:(1->4)-alpha-D-glucan 1-alpha-D-glucosylmutase